MKGLDPLIGREIDGYKIVGLLGHGGMARVYRSVDVHLQRAVAIKVIDPHARGDLNYRERFKREARAVAGLQHPNIVNVFRFGDADGLYYMAMEYIDGSDLAWVLEDYRNEGELMPHDAVLKVTTQIASALDYAHNQNVIHRDIKPSNIMLNLKGDSILTDFGLALVATEGTQGDIFGSPRYMAPEQAIHSGSVVAQSDLYSLGVVLYEMLTGRVPFTDGTAMQIAMAHISDTPPPPQIVNPALHPAFIPVLDTVLSKEPKQRYVSGAKLVTALRTAIKAASEETTRVGSGRRKPLTSPALRLSQVDLATKVRKHRQLNPLQETMPQVRLSGPQAKPRKARTRLYLLVILLIVALGSAVALTQWGGNNAGGPAPSTFMVEGVVERIDANVITLYGVDFVLPPDAALLSQISVGDTVHLEGDYEPGGGQVHVTRIDRADVTPGP